MMLHGWNRAPDDMCDMCRVTACCWCALVNVFWWMGVGSDAHQGIHPSHVPAAGSAALCDWLMLVTGLPGCVELTVRSESALCTPHGVARLAQHLPPQASIHTGSDVLPSAHPAAIANTHCTLVVFITKGVMAVMVCDD